MAQFYDRLVERLEAIPGVIRAGAIDMLPLTGEWQNNFAAVIEEFPPAEGALPPVFGVRRATPGYFDAMDIPVVEGRVFTPDDHNRRLPSVIISNSVKARYWPGTSALGKRIDIGNVSARVVGVVGDVHDTSLDEPADQFLYLPMLDAAGGRRASDDDDGSTAVEPLSLVSAIRSAIAELDGDLPMAKVQSDGARARRFDEPHQLHDVCAPDRRADRALPGSCGHLRGAVLRGEPAHSRRSGSDWHSARVPAPCAA